MDILYTLGTGSKWDNNELRYSLRSIDTNGIHVGRVYIASERLPDFVNPEEVTLVQVGDDTSVKHLNIMKKVEFTMRNSKISDDFLLSSDDHFYIKPTDFENYPIYYIEQPIRERTHNPYWLSVRDTRNFMTLKGMTTFPTNPHCNTHFSRTLYMEHISLMDESKNLIHGAEVNHLMGNILIERGAKPVLYRDVKVKRYNKRDELLSIIGDTHCFSISDRALDCGIKDYLQELFPNKCKYEL